MPVPDLGLVGRQLFRALRIRQDFLVTSSSGRSNTRPVRATRSTSSNSEGSNRCTHSAMRSIIFSGANQVSSARVVRYDIHLSNQTPKNGQTPFSHSCQTCV